MTSPHTRASLEALMNDYLEALVAHEPARLPLAKTVRHTENTILLPVGEALWATASDLPTYRLYVCDPQTGQVGLFGLMQENGFPIIISTRLKTEKGLITEIETIVVRGGERPIPIENLVEPKAVYREALKSEERVSREEMVRVSDLYFEALVRDDGDSVPLWDECNRLENGMQTTNNPDLFPPDPGRSPMPLDCRGQISSGTFAYISEIQPRRYTVIDEERGITFGTFMFHHKGTINSIEVPGVGTVEMIPIARRPFTVVVSELFKIVNGKIREIEAIMTSLPYGAKSGWDD
ncbi:MAG: hypothetical protein JXA51_06935 [Dehalococcoidales bacterium]|nr:hypothetical protein [Dehalococcoidales bacterium]